MRDYHSTHMVPYDIRDNGDCRGYLSVEVLPYLKGRKWDEVALAYVHSVRPSSIRVTTGACTADSYRWRVTVIVDEKDVIKEITQEVEVWLPEGITHGQALRDALAYGIDSSQVKWYDDPTVTGYTYAFGKYYKNCDQGMVEYPYPEKKDVLESPDS